MVVSILVPEPLLGVYGIFLDRNTILKVSTCLAFWVND